jgi:hypothetical protein
MALRFLLDEHLRDGPLWQAIQQHNARGTYQLDVKQVGDPNDLPRGTSDPDMLIWAEREGRIVVSLDHNSLPGHLAVHLQTGHLHPGFFSFDREVRFRKLSEVLRSLPTPVTR